MLLKMPAYCDSFHCIADRCSDSCCIGWEIDIDEQTAAYYESLDGEIGQRMKASINHGDTCSFILDEQERCPFMNAQGLCDLILTLGEDALCGICTEHPRYYGWFGDIKEGGIGLCCEEAARIILTWHKPFSVTSRDVSETPDEPCDEMLYDFLEKAREQVICHLERQDIPLQQRIADVLFYAEALQDALNEGTRTPETIEEAPRLLDFPMDTILEMMGQLEAMGSRWHPWVETCSTFDAVKAEEMLTSHPEVSLYLQNIAVYFVWRYLMQSVHDGDLMGHLGFMAGSAAVIRHMFGCCLLEQGSLSERDCIRIAVNYSKEIEYAEENRIAMEDAFYACIK